MDKITVVIPVSPMPSHPNDEILEESLKAIKDRLPESEIIIMFDGVAPTLMHLKADYEQYVQQMLQKINQMKNVTPLVFQEHQHQGLMFKEALKLIKTPLILWNEQDTPIVGDVPFKELGEIVETGYANLIRLHHEAEVHPEHQYLMLDEKPISVLGQPLIRTVQWSGRPHLASTKFYKYLVDKYWSDKPMFIEHIMYGKVAHGDYDEFRLHIYAPQGSQQRSIHLDGRRKGAAEHDPTPS